MKIKSPAGKIILKLSILTAVIYNIWPLGYWLDPSALNDNYLSVLEVYSKPYAWVFILGDALTATVVIIIGLRLLKLIQPPHKRSALIGYLVFGVATLFEATTPISNRCDESISACGISPVQIFSVHDLASIIAALGLFYALYKSLAYFKAKGEETAKSCLARCLNYTFWIWSISGLFLVASVGLNRATLISQALFIMACGLALIMLPLAMLQLTEP